MCRKPVFAFFRSGLYLTTPLVEVFRVERFFHFHQRPGNDQKLRCQFHPHLGADTFLPLTSSYLVRMVDDKLFVIE